MNGELVPRDKFYEWIVKDDDFMTVRKGVAGKGGSQVLELVALIALTIVTWGGTTGLDVAVGTALGVSGATAAGIIMVAGALVIQGIAALTSPKALTGTSASSTGSTQYSINGVSNSARPMEPLPLVLGTMLMYPDIGSTPFVNYINNEQYLYSIFNFGLGNLSITDICIGTNALASYTGVQQQWSDANGDITLFPGDVQSQTGGSLDWTDDNETITYITKTTEPGTTQIDVDLSGTVYSVDSSGNIQNATCYINVEITPTGGDTWTSFVNPTGSAYSNPLVNGAAVSQTSTVQTGTGAYNYLPGNYIPTTYVNSAYGNYVNLSNNSQETINTTVSLTVTAGQYDVRVSQVTTPPTTTSTQISTQFDDLKSYIPDTTNYKYQTRLALAIQASGQLNGTISQLNAMVSNEIPTNPSYDGATWVTQATSNPAWIYLYFARGIFDDAGNRLAGAGLPDDRIDIAGLIEWAQWCDENNWTCNMIVDQQGVVSDTLQSIAQCGLGQIDYSKGILGVIYDEADMTPVQMFGMPNIKAGSFQVTYISANLADEFVVNFTNPATNWQIDSVSQMIPGVTVPSNSTSIDFTGCTSEDQAGRFANYLAAQQYYRVRQIQFECDIEGLVAGKGDVIQLSHDLTQWSVSGRLAPGSSTISLVLDRQITFTASSTPYITVRYPDGTMVTCEVEESIGTTNTISLVDPLGQNPSDDPDGKQPMDYIYFFDPLATPGFRAKILSKQYMGNDANWVQIIATDDPSAFYEAIGGDYTYVAPAALNQIQPGISNVSIVQELTNSTTGEVTLYVSWTATNAAATHVRYLPVGSPNWVDAGLIQTTSFQFTEDTIGVVEVELTAVPLVTTSLTNSIPVVTAYTVTSNVSPSENLAQQMPNVAGLQLQQGTAGLGNVQDFSGQDAKFTWYQVSSTAPELGSEPSGGDSGAVDYYFSNYYVTILNTDGTIRRTEAVTDNSYIYTYEKNIEDGSGTPARTFTIQVVAHGTSNQVSAVPATLTVSNPAPDVPTGIAFAANVSFVSVSWDAPDDTDYAGMLIYGSTDDTFTPSSDNLLADITSTNSTLITGLTADTTYYFYLEPYDLFGQTGLNQSSQYTCATILITGTEITDSSITTPLLATGSVTTDILAADSVTEDKVDISELSAITANVGALTGGTLSNNSGTNVINLSATGTSDFISTPYLKIEANGTATFSGSLGAATGTFSGSLSAATGTFAGSLSAASGTFTGSLSGASGTFSGSLTAQTITAANIVDSTLTSNQMANGAVSNVATYSAYTGGSPVGLEIAAGGSATIFSGSFTGAYTTMITVRINFYAGDASMDCQANLEVDGTVVDSGYFKFYSSSSAPANGSISLNAYITDPSEGSHTVTVVGINNNGGGLNYWYSMPFMSILRLLN